MGYTNDILYWHYEPEIEEERIFDAALTLSSKSGTAMLLPEIADFMCEHIGSKYVMISRICKDQKSAQTLVFMENRKLKENFTYSLKGSPFEVSVARSICYYPYNVTLDYPEDKKLRNLQIESFLGNILLSENNIPLGFTALLDTKQIPNAAFAQHLVMILSPAIEQEITKLYQ
jgi:hypothetical protein